ncbi:baseplate J/gp47 family protein [Clostridium sp. AF18-27]|uniref:Uncharacterized phage protein gp47/JayE n=1 Tax=Enterocloster lavalensis TaxID=460384 RepID=A0A1I0GLX4_9FIRM|nr:baseplate J/gp47 family protein [Enterocloster lavalensis]RHR53372.1 baseplate J/gp47 family protein [Clostridium sp. AF18-27]SET71222.1 Uncharacterized phage protein gp47/JayE [Enterocloster lavalensis]
MYEDTTYEIILERMLRNVKENSPELDTRQSSPVYTALAPAAVELQNAYIELGWTLDQMFAETAVREYLIRRCSEWNITPHPAAKAVLKGEFNMEIELGARFSLGTLNYVAVERIGDRTYRMECETAGALENRELGAMVPVDYIPGLTKAELTEIIDSGSDEESTESLLDRYLTKVQKPSTSGNRYDYYNWAMECDGVGAARVFPLANGPGTVKVVISDAGMSAAGAGLVQEVQEHIEELRPVGADVTVASVTEKAINVSAGIKVRTGTNLGTVEHAFQAAMAGYLRKEALDLSYVSLAKIGNLLLGIDGVEDYFDLLLNGDAGNVSLNDEELAVPGAITLEVAR